MKTAATRTGTIFGLQEQSKHHIGHLRHWVDLFQVQEVS